jgi:hypothetical protein
MLKEEKELENEEKSKINFFSFRNTVKSVATGKKHNLLINEYNMIQNLFLMILITKVYESKDFLYG